MKRLLILLLCVTLCLTGVWSGIAPAYADEGISLEEPVLDEPVPDEPIQDEPIQDEPVLDEPVPDEPVLEEPVPDEPVPDEPVPDEPVPYEPADDTLAAKETLTITTCEPVGTSLRLAWTPVAGITKYSVRVAYEDETPSHYVIENKTECMISTAIYYYGDYTVTVSNYYNEPNTPIASDTKTFTLPGLKLSPITIISCPSVYTPDQDVEITFTGVPNADSYCIESKDPNCTGFIAIHHIYVDDVGVKPQYTYSISKNHFYNNPGVFIIRVSAHCNTYQVKDVSATARVLAEEAPVQFTIDVGEEYDLWPVVDQHMYVNHFLGYRTSSSNNSVVKCTWDGTIIGLKPGKATISITNQMTNYQRGRLKLSVTVVHRATSVAITGADSVGGGFSATLKAVIEPSNASQKSVAWSIVGDAAGATISAKGVLKTAAVETQTGITVRAETTDGSHLSDEHTITVFPVASSVSVYRDGADVTGQTLSIDLSTDDTLAFTTVVLPEAASDDVTWKSGKTTVATIDANGTVTGKKAGKTVITATSADGSKKSASVTLNVGYAVQRISIRGDTNMLAGGKKTTLKLFFTPEKPTTKTVLWTTSDETVATVNKSGVVTAKKVTERKSVTIFATATDGTNVVGKYEMQVFPAVTSVDILIDGAVVSKGTIVMEIGESCALDAVCAPENAAQDVSWKSSSAKAATMEGNVVTARANGTAKLTATAKDGTGRSAFLTLKVGKKMREIHLTGSADTLAAGKKSTLKASFVPEKPTLKTLVWSTSDATAATVDKKGVVTAQRVTEEKHVTIRATATDGSGTVGEYLLTVTP